MRQDDVILGGVQPSPRHQGSSWPRCWQQTPGAEKRKYLHRELGTSTSKLPPASDSQRCLARWPSLEPGHYPVLPCCLSLDLSFPLSPASETHSFNALAHPRFAVFLFPSPSLHLNNPAPLINLVRPNPHFFLCRQSGDRISETFESWSTTLSPLSNESNEALPIRSGCGFYGSPGSDTCAQSHRAGLYSHPAPVKISRFAAMASIITDTASATAQPTGPQKHRACDECRESPLLPS